MFPFCGSYPAILDAKGRLVLPARFREILTAKGEGMLILTYLDLDRRILAYPRRQWELVGEKISSLPDSDPTRDDYITYFFSLANECPIDNQGRILIPPNLRQRANINKEVVLSGAPNKITLWNRQTWEEFEARMSEKPAIRGVIHGLGF